MSEYQYYEFQAIDRPLTAKEQGELRSYSTRARITATSFINDYSWGSFKGNPDLWMEKYFDAFLYLANWGTRVLKLRLPSSLLPVEDVRTYCYSDLASAREKNHKIILSFVSEEEPNGEWEDGGRAGSHASFRFARSWPEEITVVSIWHGFFQPRTVNLMKKRKNPLFPMA
jgi:hypothetical protein